MFSSFPPTDGIYVLLRRQSKPQKNQKKGSIVHQPKVPAHLAHLVLQDIPPDACPWSLSGPQYPRPTAMQQRYCYPKEEARPQYSCCKGSALWTMFRDGVEDQNYRLLHVYFSTKRANNRGVSVPDDEEASSSRSSARSRAPKRSKKITSPPRNVYPVNNRASFFASPTMTAVSTTSPSLHDSPLRFDDLSPPSLGPFGNSHFVTPNSDPFRHCEHSDKVSMLTPSPFRPKLPVAQHNISQSPLYRSAFKNDDSDPFLFDITTSWHEIDSFWNDPLLDIMLKPSQDYGIDRLQVSSSSSSLSPLTSKQETSEQTQSFSARLEILTHTLHERILTAPVEEHSALVTQLKTWASALAQDPFSETLLPEASAGEDAKDDNGSQITRESHEDDSKCSWVHSTLV
jgi:hypothetical protein